MLIDELQSLHQRNRVIASAVVLVIFGMLLARTFELQVIRAGIFLERSEQNRIREVVVEPSRGLMYDRNGVLIVDTRPSFSVWIIPYEVNQSKTVIPLLTHALGSNAANLKSRINKFGRGFQAERLASQISFQQLSILEENKLDLPGVIYRTDPMRFYFESMRAPHILGYISEANQAEIEKFGSDQYGPGDVIGKQGLELQYEQFVRGHKGYRYLQVDAVGREIRQISFSKQDIPPRKGADLQLTIDKNLQVLVESLYEGKKGAAVFLNPNNGEVFAMTSQPDFDPNLFAGKISTDAYNQLITDPETPLYNRAIQGTYPAGSTYKLISVLAAVNEQIITPQWRRSCYGQFRLGRGSFACFRGTSHGQLNLLQAIERSCNVYFYKLGLEVGHASWSHYSQILRFGTPTFIDIPQEVSGIVPTKEFMDDKFGENGWTEGNLLNMVIGQGDVLVTPIQMARFAAILATNGKVITPHLVRAIENIATGDWDYVSADTTHITAISEEVFHIIREGMWRVVQGDRGTARGSRLPGIEYCGKTGTAQNPHGEDHGWFIGFAPAENPQIAFAVLVEHGGTGGGSAAPIAREVLREFFSTQKNGPLATPVTRNDY